MLFCGGLDEGVLVNWLLLIGWRLVLLMKWVRLIWLMMVEVEEFGSVIDIWFCLLMEMLDVLFGIVIEGCIGLFCVVMMWF